MAYSHDGEGLHRTVDPEDGRAYVYAMTFLDAAPRVFACFDQPDLKAAVRLRVKAPDGLDRARQRRARAQGDSARRLVDAGGHPAAVDVLRHRGRRAVPLDHQRARRHPAGPALSRQSLADAPRQGRRGAVHGHRAVLRRVPPAVRHPLPVRRLPPGVRARSSTRARWRTRDASRSRDEMVFRAQATDAQRSNRANVVAHEMAHQWFGDLVTMHVVGRPLAQRVLRGLHGPPGVRRRHGVHRQLAAVRLRTTRPGASTPTSDPPRTRSPATAPGRPLGTDELRRHLLLQGLRGAPAAQQLPRRRGVPRRDRRPPPRTPTATRRWPT